MIASWYDQIPTPDVNRYPGMADATASFGSMFRKAIAEGTIRTIPTPTMPAHNPAMHDANTNNAHEPASPSIPADPKKYTSSISIRRS
jgi:hypothetical protein